MDSTGPPCELLCHLCLVCAPFLLPKKSTLLFRLYDRLLDTVCLYNMYVCVCLDGMGVGGRVRPLGRAGPVTR